jgi:tripartite-type tricarboxylate transporter receptor subunit TctC
MTLRTPLRRVVPALLMLASAWASAQIYPAKPITMVVPFPPGGTTDILARSLANKLSADLRQTVIIDNRQGAGGNTGADLVAKSRPDGYTIMLSSAGPLAINQYLYLKQTYDPLRDFAPVAMVANVPIMLVANPTRPFKTVPELIAYAKANPGKLTYGSQGNGTTSHLTMELLKRQAGIDIVHVPYRGSAPASTDLIGGVIDLMFDNSPSTEPQVQSHTMRGLAIASGSRVKGLNYPTLSETVKGFESVAWFAIVAPAGTPPDVIATLNHAVNAALKLPDMQDKFLATGVQLTGGTPQEMDRYVRKESEKWGAVVRSTGLKLD